VIGVAVVVAALAGGVGGCSSGSGRATRDASSYPPCPVDPLDVVVTVEQWSDVVGQLAGDCGRVTTIIQGADVDPHEFEPTPADNLAFTRADLVVLNGLGYDHWAENVLDTVSPDPAVVDAGSVVGLAEGDNPHVWYGPTYVQQVSDAVSRELAQLSPDAAAYFEQRSEAWTSSLQPYLDEVAAVRALATGTPYGATESVFDDMAAAVGLVDETPEGYRAAAANESDPAPGDINAFQEALRAGRMAVLVHNTQTEGSVPEQIRQVAESAGVPVVEVTESTPSDVDGFVDWQISQLRALAAALGG
jgi:zinc/manganese transport system substrate-binding protein